MKAFIVALLLSPIQALIGGLWFMLAVGIVHAEWLPKLPTIGYWWAVLIVFLLAGVFEAPRLGGDK
jgi:hypothetical protein